MPGPPFTVVESGGLAVTQVESGAPVMTFVESGGVAVTVVESGGLPFVLEGYGGAPAPVEPLPFNMALEGDSQTIWAGSWAHQFIADNPTFDAQIFANSASMLGLPANAGDGGNTLWGRTATVLADLPSHVAFLIGGNDDAQRGGIATAYVTGIEEYTDHLKGGRPGLQVIVATILPDGGAGGAQQNPNRAVANPLLLAQRGARFLDVMDFGGHPLMSDSAPDDVTYFQTDKVHATQPAALALLGSIAKAVLNPIRDERTVESVSFFDNAGDVAGWTNATGVTAGATFEETLIVTGLPPGTTVAVSCTTGTLSIGRGAFSTTPGNTGNGQALTRRRVASTTPGATVPQEITIGASTFTPTVQTAAAPTARVAYIRLGGAAPASNWNAPDNLFALGTRIANIKDSAEVNTGWSFFIDNVFDGTSTNVGAVSTIDWVPDVVLSTAAYCDATTAVFGFAGLDEAKTYTLNLPSCRMAGTTRNTLFTINGVPQPEINSANNDDTQVTAVNVAPDENGEITIVMSIGSPNDINFAYANAVRITENG